MIQILSSSCLATLFWILLLRPLAIRWHWEDHPSARKIHQKPVPLMGGAAFFLGFLTAALFGFPLPTHLLFSSVVVVLLGILDDRYNLAASVRLIGQSVGVFTFLLLGGDTLQDLGNLLGSGSIILHQVALPVTLLGMVGVMNAVNWMDGVDGLSGGITWLIFATFAGLCWYAGRESEVNIWMGLLASLSTYLFFNVSGRSKIFMGSAGAFWLGWMVVIGLVHYSQIPTPLFQPVTALWIMGLPLLDIGRVMIRRGIQKQPLWQGDQGHLHHILLKKGCRPLHVTSILLLAQGILISIGLWLEYQGIPENIRFFSFIGLFIIYAGLLAPRKFFS